MSKPRPVFAVLATVAASLLLVASLKLPLWHLKMEAPQYQGREALRVRVYPGSMAGDLREIRVLNHYIGVHIPEHLPELRWLPWVLVVGAGLGIAVAFLPRLARSRSLAILVALLAAALFASAALGQYQMREIGHHRDPHPILKGVGDFTPPLLGTARLAQFTLTAGLGGGALLISFALGLQLLAAWLWRPSPVPLEASGRTAKKTSVSTTAEHATTLAAFRS